MNMMATSTVTWSDSGMQQLHLAMCKHIIQPLVLRWRQHGLVCHCLCHLIPLLSRRLQQCEAACPPLATLAAGRAFACAAWFSDVRPALPRSQSTCCSSSRSACRHQARQHPASPCKHITGNMTWSVQLNSSMQWALVCAQSVWTLTTRCRQGKLARAYAQAQLC